MTAKAQDFPVGSVKQDPETDNVAVRVKDGRPSPWFVLDLEQGGHYTDVKETETVVTWPDLKPPAKTTRKTPAKKG